MNEQTISQSMMDTKMTKSATGADISPMITSSSTIVQPLPAINISNTPHNIPPLLISGISGASGTPTPPASAQQQHQQNPNFPRGTRNRQTFHGKTEHTKVYFIILKA